MTDRRDTRGISRRDLFRYGGTLGFGAIGAGMLASCTPLAGDRFTGSASPPDVPAAQAKNVVIVVVDGCRADYISSDVHLPNIEHMIRTGTRYTNAWTGSMESITPACHAALGTGKFAKNNGGILGFWWQNPDNGSYGESVNLANSITQGQPGSEYAVDPTSLEQILQNNNVPTMASYLKDVDPSARVYAGAGAKFYAVDAAGGPDADYMTYIWNYGGNYYRGCNIGGPNHIPIDNDLLNSVHRNDYTNANYGEVDPKTGEPILSQTGTWIHPPHVGESDTMVVELARKVITRHQPRIVILNLGNQDWPYGHLNGGILSPKWWKTVMTNVDAGIGSLRDTYQEMGELDQTVFMLLGDHGMVPIHQQVDRQQVMDIIASSGNAVIRKGAGADFHTGGFIWLENPLKAYKSADFVDDAIEARNLRGVIGVYFRGEAGGAMQYFPSPWTASNLPQPTQRAYEYLLDTLNGDNAPHLILAFQEWTGTAKTGSGNQVWFGDHGGASWESHSVPLIMSGPGIRAGYVSSFPARLVDLAPTGLRLMGVPYPSLDGIALADAFTHPARNETRAQTAVAMHLTPVVAALKRQSQIDKSNLTVYGAVNPPLGSPATAQNSSTGAVY